MKFTLRRAAAIVFALGFAWWFWHRATPETFFADLSMPIPTRYVVSHQSPFNLLSMRDRLILKIPRAEVATTRRIFAAQKDFEDVTPNLPRHYTAFRNREEKFFPPCPKAFAAGRFVAYDRQRHWYGCSFLFDLDNPDFALLYLDSGSPTN